jgi:hypothetical protein
VVVVFIRLWTSDILRAFMTSEVAAGVVVVVVVYATLSIAVGTRDAFPGFWRLHCADLFVDGPCSVVRVLHTRYGDVTNMLSRVSLC